MNDALINGICVVLGAFGGRVYTLMASHIANKAKRDEAEIAYKAKRDEADAKLKELEIRLKYSNDQKELYKAIAKDGIVVLERVTNEKLISEGNLPIVPMADVLANHHSLVTEEGKESADYETMKAAVAAARLILGFQAKEPGEMETEEQRAARLAEEAKALPHDTPQGLGTRLTTTQVDQLNQKIDKALDKVDKVPEKVVEKLKEEGEV